MLKIGFIFFPYMWNLLDFSQIMLRIGEKRKVWKSFNEKLGYIVKVYIYIIILIY